MRVVIEKKAAKYLENLDAVMKQRIEQALKDLAKEPPSGDIVTLHSFIDDLPDYCLSSVEPLLSYLAREPAIETNLTAEEKKWVQEGRTHYKEHPEDFVPLTLS